MTPERLNRIRSVLNKRQPDLTVVTDEVHKHRNVAAIVRNCDAIGVGTIHCVTPETGYQLFSGTSSSAEKWVDAHHYATIDEPLTLLSHKGYQIIAAEFAEDAVDYREVDYTLPTAIVMGAELKGVSQTGNTFANKRILLPMMGMVESYNVSVANALILNEAQRQREAAGLYDEKRLSDEESERLFFQWAHPKLAQFCDERDLVYPTVSEEDGEVVNAPQWYEDVRKGVAPKNKSK